MNFELIEAGQTASLVKLNVRTGHCWNERTTRSRCTLCVDACPQACIQLGPNPNIDTEACHSCGLCASACPTGAITIPRLYTADFLKAAPGEGTNGEGMNGDGMNGNGKSGICTLTCVGKGGSPGQARKQSRNHQDRGHQPGKNGSGEGPRHEMNIDPLLCLGALEPTHLVNLVAQGFGKVVLDASGCADCDVAGGAETLRRCAAKAQGWLETLGLDGSVSINADTSGSPRQKGERRHLIRAESLSRRGLFQQLRRRGMAKVARKVDEYSQDDGNTDVSATDGKFIPPERSVLLDIMINVAIDRDDDSGKLPWKVPADPAKLPIRHVEASPKCIVCQSCAQLCPTGALEQIEDRERAALLFHSSRCVGCDNCADLCPHGMLRSRILDTSSFPLHEPRLVFARKKVPCNRCERPFMPMTRTRTCPGCLHLEDIDEEMKDVLGW